MKIEEAGKIEVVNQTSVNPVATTKISQNYIPTRPEIISKAGGILLSRWCGAIALLTLLVVTLAYQFSPTIYVKLGGGYDQPFLNIAEQGFSYAVRFDYDDGQSLLAGSDNEASGTESVKVSTPQTGPEAVKENYRWTRTRPILLLAGVGEAVNLRLRAAASPTFAAGQKVEILLNGQPYTSFNVKPGLPQEFEFDLGKATYPYQGGNLAVEMRVTPLGPADNSVGAPKNGFKLYAAWLTPKSGPTLPPVGVALGLLAAMLAFYFGLAYSGLARRWSFGAAALLVIASGLLLALKREDLTIYTGRLALLTLVAAISLPLLDWSLPRLFRRWRLPLSQKVWQGLLLMFVLGLLLRGGGVLYPQAVIIDAPAHLLEINKITSGQILQQYTNRDLSKVPGQWNSSAIIPYSTISYFLLAPFAKLPIDPNISVNLVNVYLDALRVFIIFGLALALGVGTRAGLVAAGLYLLSPSSWRLNSWGNWPTTISFWLAILYVTLALVLYRDLGKRRVWLSLTALLTLTMMIYSVTAVFIGMLLYSWAFGLFFVIGRGDKLARQNGRRIFFSTTFAAIGAVVLYYWQFLPDISTTLTSFDQSMSSGAGLGGLGNRGFADYMWLYTDHVFNLYGAGALLALALAVYGWSLFASAALRWREAGLTLDEPEAELRSGRNLWLVGSWFALFVLFGVAQWKVDMVDKQVWFTLPLIVCLAGVAFVYLWDKLKTPTLLYGGRLLVLALTGWLTYSSITLWIYRIFFKRH